MQLSLQNATFFAKCNYRCKMQLSVQNESIPVQIETIYSICKKCCLLGSFGEKVKGKLQLWDEGSAALNSSSNLGRVFRQNWREVSGGGKRGVGGKREEGGGKRGGKEGGGKRGGGSENGSAEIDKCDNLRIGWVNFYKKSPSTIGD